MVLKRSTRVLDMCDGIKTYALGYWICVMILKRIHSGPGCVMVLKRMHSGTGYVMVLKRMHSGTGYV